jgi:hypothetical protein
MPFLPGTFNPATLSTLPFKQEFIFNDVNSSSTLAPEEEKTDSPTFPHFQAQSLGSRQTFGKIM